MGISSTTLYNLAWSESTLDPTKYSKTGDRGIVQVNEKYHAEVSDQCAYDPLCSLTWAANRIKKGYLYEWTVANCYSYVSLFVDLPKMAQIKSNATPAVGRVAIFSYKGVKHIALITKLNTSTFSVKEANYHPALISTREVSYNDKSLIGFYSP